MSKQVVYIILGVCGVIFILGASIFLGLFNGIIKTQIKKELPLNYGSDAFKRWREIEVPIYMKFHIFNLTNIDYNKNLSNIKLEEKGPYVFQEKRTKENIEYFENDKKQFLLKYRERKVYTFNEKLSPGLSLNDSITFINLPFLGILFNKVTKNYAINALNDGNISVNEKSMFTKRTVGELLFDGFSLSLFEKIESDIPFFKLNPWSISDGGSNKSEEPWAIYPGIPNLDNFGQLAQFDNHYKLEEKGYLGETKSIWPKDINNTHCNKLKGTDGTMFPPSLSKSERLYAFEPQLCRSVFFDFKEETSVKDIKTYRYVVPYEYYQSPVKYPENECYCLGENVTEECNWNGVLDISNCLRLSKGAPVIMSAPYFNYGDQHIRDLINLKVDKKDLTDEKYGTYLDIEPMTGTVLKAMRRLQVNLKLVPNDHFEELKLLAKTEDKKIAIPLIWIEETAEADDKQANQFKDMVTNKVKLGIGFSIAVIVIGALMLITAIVLIVRHRRGLKVCQNNNNTKY